MNTQKVRFTVRADAWTTYIASWKRFQSCVDGRARVHDAQTLISDERHVDVISFFAPPSALPYPCAIQQLKVPSLSWSWSGIANLLSCPRDTCCSCVFITCRRLFRSLRADPPYQIQYWYRHGRYDSCNDAWKDLWLCMKAKLAQNEDEAQVMGEREKGELRRVAIFEEISEANDGWNRSPWNTMEAEQSRK